MIQCTGPDEWTVVALLAGGCDPDEIQDAVASAEAALARRQPSAERAPDLAPPPVDY